MDVSGKNVKIWRKDLKRKDGKEFYKYTASIGKKMDDGTWINAYIPVFFTKKADAPDKIENGTVCDFEGFMSVESYRDKEGNVKTTPQIVITSALFDGDGFKQAEEDIPFN